MQNLSKEDLRDKLMRINENIEFARQYLEQMPSSLNAREDYINEKAKQRQVISELEARDFWK